MNFHGHVISHLAALASLCFALGLSTEAHAQSTRSWRSDVRDPEPAPRMMPANELLVASNTSPYSASPYSAAPYPAAPTMRYADSPQVQYAQQPVPADFDERYAQYRARYYPQQPTVAEQQTSDDGAPVFEQAGPVTTLDQPPGSGAYGAPIAGQPQYAQPQYGAAPYGQQQFIQQPYAQAGYGPDNVGPCATCPDDPNADAGDGGWFHNWKRRCCLFSPVNSENFASFGGVQAFKGPVDRGVNGNFGIQKGLNWARPLWDELGIGYQLGGVISLSDFEGGAGLVNHGRDQFFATTGIFRRAEGNQGFQAGAVVDYLYDSFYVRMNLLQVRWEIAYRSQQNEVGIWSAQQANSDTRPAPAAFGQPTVAWVANNQFNLFYRRHFRNGSQGRMWIGLSPFHDVIFGGDVTAHMSERWAIQASYNYLLPSLDPMITNSIKETWNISLCMVCFVGYKSPCAPFNPYRPMFNVADNGWFLVKERN